MTKFVELRSKFNGKRMYIDAHSILEVHESSLNGCTLVIKNCKDVYEVSNSFDEVRALIDYDPAVADIVRKGSGV